MRKTISVTDKEEIAVLKQLVMDSIDKSVEQIRTERDAYGLFSKMKFGGVGVDPLDSERELNVIEPINQSFTYLASFNAMEVLFKYHSELAPYTLNLGTASGSDIESHCGTLAAEVFASVTPNNNQKLKKDIDKVAATDAQLKYVFFMCPNFEYGRQIKFERDSVVVWALEGANAL
ncbi:Uncharacterised protein [Vibrio cholerae]|uniref:Uncharacterized protein n=2 Tax=Vibrio cholerae TaxID=666 RepID=A0A656A0U0_VIBCL|nr:hypothetical protein [Vibrio cholerae]EKF9168889.1 hypothetical protein [Vibrio cholerae]ELJ8739376.1 hypothetical protein [Vibrio cholerae]CSC91269.1 Uncharacterised protein [Vibrio cholerae]CSE27214.1 Uncharacterised protein [Vibrio cholerae]